MTQRVNPFINLPTSMDPDARRALIDILRQHVTQINWATGQENTAIASASASRTGIGRYQLAHDLVTVDATAATITVGLLPAARWYDREMRIKLISSTNTVIVEPFGSETIDGTACATISTQFSVMRIISDGSQWWKV